MTHEDKQLLLKDLCARLPYGVIIKYQNKDTTENFTQICDYITYHMVELFPIYDDFRMSVIPYLRPMASMTDEEKEEFEKVMRSCTEKILTCPTNERWYQFFDAEEQDFMNAHHFDFRGLIEKGLALKAPEDMYKEN